MYTNEAAKSFFNYNIIVSSGKSIDLLVQTVRSALSPWALLAIEHCFWLVNIMKSLFAKPIMIRLWNATSQTIRSSDRFFFFLSHPLIGSINGYMFILTNWQVVLMGLSKNIGFTHIVLDSAFYKGKSDENMTLSLFQ